MIYWKHKVIILGLCLLGAILLNIFLILRTNRMTQIKQIIEEVGKNYCQNQELTTSIKQRGNYWVLYNYMKADKKFGCLESITYTTMADVRFMESIIPLAQSWQGPISIAIYAPGVDFYKAVVSIAYLRQCTSTLIIDFVSFHIFFDTNHRPKQAMEPIRDISDVLYNCSGGPPYQHITSGDLYKSKNKLTFPINVARNIARESSQTYFVLASDIELYPSLNFIENFLNLVMSNQSLIDNSSKNVFVLPPFEVKKNAAIPRTKTDLRKMLKRKEAFPFYHKVCTACHGVPDGKRWMETPETNGLNIFKVAKRHGKHKYWEPFYVSTNKEPFFEERVHWEDGGDKMGQAYSLCLLDYNFMILDNAFLVHEPGIKEKNTQTANKSKKEIIMSEELIRDTAGELVLFYGNNSKCEVKRIRNFARKSSSSQNVHQVTK